MLRPVQLIQCDVTGDMLTLSNWNAILSYRNGDEDCAGEKSASNTDISRKENSACFSIEYAPDSSLSQGKAKNPVD